MMDQVTRSKLSQIIFITIFVVFIAVIPWLMRLKVYPIDNNILLFWTGLNTIDDFFSFYKRIFVIITGVLALLTFGLAMYKSEVILKRTWLYIPLSLYALLVLISCIVSDYKKVAWLGGPDRCEGALVLLAYLILCFVGIHMIRNRGQIRIIVWAFLLSSGLLGIMGICEFYGFSLISTQLGEYLFIPASQRHAVSITCPRTVVATLYNPNNAGMYFAMVFVFTLVGFFHISKPRGQIVVGTVCCIVFASLLGTYARGAWIGTCLSLILTVWLLRKTIFQRRLPALLITLGLLVTYLIMNQSGLGALNTRMGSIGTDISQAQLANPWVPNNSDKGVIQGKYGKIRLRLNNNELTLQASGQPPLKIRVKEGRLSFYDVQQEKIRLGADNQKNWYFRSPQYKDYSLRLNKDRLSLVIGDVVLPELRIIDGKHLWFGSQLTAAINGIESDKHTLTIRNKVNDMLSLKLREGEIVCSDREGRILPLQLIQDRACYIIADSRFADYLLIQKNNILLIDKGGRRIRFEFTDQGVMNLDVFGRRVPVKPAASLGFAGRESMFSNRGYIWSRTMPLLKDAIWLGHGPDTFFIYFPQDDRIGKYMYLYSAEAVVDKPHNLYLQTWMNTGLLSLLAFIALMGYYIISSLKLYGRDRKEDGFSSVGIGCLAAVIAYLISGFVYDSNISVAPVFWGLLGLGMACNLLYQQSTD